jgi:hypothetical protein
MTRGSSFPCVTDGAGKADGGAGRLDEVAEKSREDSKRRPDTVRTHVPDHADRSSFLP